MADGTRWSKDELKLAFNLYCQLPFGRLHSKNPEIIELAALLDRTPSAVAMKLVNFASLDPAVTDTGRTGLGNASQMDREVWAEFHKNWAQLAAQSSSLLDDLRSRSGVVMPTAGNASEESYNYYGETAQATVELRLKQSFFRKSVLANYLGRCCMTGITAESLLVASHIVPWSADPNNRLNPRNGLCLSALHDRAYDRGLISVDTDHGIRISSRLKKHAKETVIRQSLIELEDKKIRLPEKFRPDQDFLRYHHEKIFLGDR